MSYGFQLQIVNNTSADVVFFATVAHDDEWASPDELRPDKDLPKYPLSPFEATPPIHQELANFDSTAKFTVSAIFSRGGQMDFVLDGCDAGNLDHDGEVATTGSAGLAVYQMTSHARDTGAGWRRMTIFITPRVQPNQWMGRLIDNSPGLRLTDITIPGTHESGTASGTGEEGTRCQSKGFWDQLQMGVRFFDLRVRPYPAENDLGIFHYTYTQNLWVGKDVLPLFKQFLADNPTESVVLCFNHAVDSDPSFDSLLRDVLIGNPGKNIPPGLAPNTLYDQNVATDLKLKNLQGCVVLMRRDPDASFGILLDPAQWKDDDADFTLDAGGESMRVQDAYKYSQTSGPWIAAAKWPNVRAMLDAAKGETASTWFVNFTSATHAGLPYAGGFPLDTAWHEWGVNAELCRYLVNNPPFRGRLGSILMDGPEEPADALACKLLIAMNEQLMDSG